MLQVHDEANPLPDRLCGAGVKFSAGAGVIGVEFSGAWRAILH
jgi:hypothetical protein